MSRSLCLIRQCLGVSVRIECIGLPLAGEQGRWTLICAAGLSDEQPSAVKAQGPFYGPLAIDEVLRDISANLALQGYVECDEPLIWQLHVQAKLRRLNGPRSVTPAWQVSGPDS